MSMPPPPPPGDQPRPPQFPQQPQFPAYGQGPYPAPPAGYMTYDQASKPTNSGMAIAGMVLSLVGLIPCFWFWFLQLPGYLGVIFSIIGLRATRGGVRRGRGMAIAGLVVGIVVVLFALGMTLFVYTSDKCVVDGLSFECVDL